VAYIDERNIDVQILGPRPFMMLGWMEPHLTEPWTQYVNDMIHQQCQFHPTRFLGACQLPQRWDAPDMTHCLPELDRCIQEYGFVATYASPDPSGRRLTPGMHEPYWYPLYERCQSLDIPIIVHGTTALDPRFRLIPHNYQLGFVTEQYFATQILGHSDVFDRFPDLRVVICHLGGALNRFIESDFHLPQRDLSRNMFFDCCGYDLPFLEAGIRQRGVDQVCFGVEAPGSGKAIRPDTGLSSDDLVPIIGEQFTWLTYEDRRKIFYDNPLKVCSSFARL
jgi:predicted TIM-barrel fold metal-dependent hydrolase